MHVKGAVTRAGVACNTEYGSAANRTVVFHSLSGFPMVTSAEGLAGVA